jgi:hypothetical protein
MQLLSLVKRGHLSQSTITACLLLPPGVQESAQGASPPQQKSTGERGSILLLNLNNSTSFILSMIGFRQ